MSDVILALDPGVTTGWALLKRRGREVLGLGDLPMDDVGCGIDLLVRTMHLTGYSVEAVVERMPTQPGVAGELATQLEYVRRTVDYWLGDVFELPVAYVLPGVWMSSRAALTSEGLPPDRWNGVPLSPHMRDALTMARYFAARR